MKALLANCIQQAELFGEGVTAAFCFIIPTAEEGGLPGQSGFRVTCYPDGSEDRQRYFAVTFAHTFMRRFRQACRDTERVSALPAIFHQALVRIGDEIGQGNKHPDDACTFVCQECNVCWTQPEAEAAPRAEKTAEKPARGAHVQQLKGRCYAYDNNGSCPKGDQCPYRSSHGSAPSRRQQQPKRPRGGRGDYESDDDKRRRDDDRRDDDRRGDDRRDFNDRRSDADARDRDKRARFRR